MRKSAFVSLVALILELAVAAPSFAWSRGHGHFHGGGRVFIGVGIGPWWGYPYYPYWYPPYAPYAYGYPYGPPTVVMEQPPVYVQQQPAPAPQAPAPSAYWYYCPSMKAYYPNVPSCVEPWVKVPPRPE